MIGDFAAAVAFLTRLPIGRRIEFDEKRVARAARWFPLVGAMLGAFSVGLLRLAGPVFPPLVVAALLVALETLFTGVLHLDGLADTADGFGAGRTREDTLRIMRDHAIGSYGGAALALALVLKVAAIGALIEAGRAAGALLAAPAIGRWSAVLLMATQPYAREGASPARFVGRVEMAVASVSAVAIVAAVVVGLTEPWRGGAALATAGLVAAGWGWRCRRRIGGITGDTLGAAVVMTECLVLMEFVAGAR
ncbi:MAG TPA: adenosylcobinamide-GDP ribazoletransferase [Verrucomicrobiae bacterium]|nr:adenosylcobinamide-GDP ribazoletransferase [Verrucomicrobiae bacterium]